MVLVDFSLAFNCVDHRLLRNKLRDEFRFSRAACDRSQVVRLGSAVSAAMQVTDGTPQGSCLSALLFSLYVNSLPRALKCHWQLYADDLQIYLSGPIANVDQLVRDVNEDLTSIAHWARANRLFPNPKKTQAVIFCKTGAVVPTEDVVFCNTKIPLSSQDDVLQKTYSTLRTFRRFGPVLSLETRRKLVQAAVMPFFTYCDVIYYPGLTATLRDRLHRCFKSAIRFVHNLRCRDTTAAVRDTILGHDLPINYRIRICCFMKQAYEGRLPGYIAQHLQRGQLDRASNFIVPRHTTSSGKSLLVHGTSSWNQLPLAIERETRTNAFKRAIVRQSQN